MPWWLITIIILFSIALVMILLIFIVKFNKSFNGEGSFGDKSIKLKIENQQPNTEASQNLQNQQAIDLDKQMDDFIKSYIGSMIDSHVLLTSVFHTIKNQYNISDKIFLKILKNKKAFDPELNTKIYIISQLYKEYSFRIKDSIILLVEELKNNIFDTNKLLSIFDSFYRVFESESCIESTITNFKSSGFKTELINGETISLTPEQIDNDILEMFRMRTKRSYIELLHDIKTAKTRLLFLNDKVVRALSGMYGILNLFDAIAKHLFDIYFESKPAILGDSEGV